MDIVLLIIGLALIIFAADLLTDGASALAVRFGMSEFMVGMTIVAIGTSMPEMVVTMISSIQGNSEVAIGNVVGSNMFNGLLIVGITAAIMPLKLTTSNLKRDFPLGIFASVILILSAADITGHGNIITRWEGILMLLLFVGFMYFTIASGRKDLQAAQASEGNTAVKHGPHIKLWVMIAKITGGLAGLIIGGELFLDNAVGLARKLNISEGVIAVTLIAGGTSLPELAASLVAAVKNKPGIALGNVVGSNVSNIFLVLGAGAAVSPLSLGDIRMADCFAVLGASVLLFLTGFTFRKKTIDRWEGALFIVLYVVYIIWLIRR